MHDSLGLCDAHAIFHGSFLEVRQHAVPEFAEYGLHLALDWVPLGARKDMGVTRALFQYWLRY